MIRCERRLSKPDAFDSATRNEDRTVEPHDYGQHNGLVKLLTYQVGGASSGPLPHWRWMETDPISDAELLGRTFRGGRPTPSGKHQNGTSSSSESNRPIKHGSKNGNPAGESTPSFTGFESPDLEAAKNSSIDTSPRSSSAQKWPEFPVRRQTNPVSRKQERIVLREYRS
jgi:hypothetical protein